MVEAIADMLLDDVLQQSAAGQPTIHALMNLDLVIAVRAYTLMPTLTGAHVMDLDLVVAARAYTFMPTVTVAHVGMCDKNIVWSACTCFPERLSSQVCGHLVAVKWA